MQTADGKAACIIAGVRSLGFCQRQDVMCLEAKAEIKLAFWTAD